jgi:ribosomal protein S6
MPLYETIIISRCGEAKGTATMLKQLAITALEKGGNVRDMKILGDRILTKSVKGNDSKSHLLGRYV